MDRIDVAVELNPVAAWCAMSRPLAPTAIAVALLLMTAGATPGPATAPATGPTVDAEIARQFKQLADPDPAVRDAARQSLMGLPVDALPKLLAIVREARPVLPAQAGALHEIVCQAYLAAEPYDGVTAPEVGDPNHQPPHYVMGIRWSQDLVFDDTLRLGVPVVERWPGFPARRLLRDGDMIRGIYIDRTASLQALPNMPTHRTADLRLAIGNSPAVHDIVLVVLRDGRDDVRVPMTLVPQPVEASANVAMADDTFVGERQKRAEAYWQDHFASALGPGDVDGQADPDNALDK